MTEIPIADSSVVIDHLRGTLTDQVQVFRTLITSGGVAIGDLVAFEVLRGAGTEARASKIQDAMVALPKVNLVSDRTAVRAATMDRELRRRGVTVRSAIDCLIAAYCIDTGTPLLHSDRDFAHFEREFGLQVVHP